MALNITNTSPDLCQGVSKSAIPDIVGVDTIPEDIDVVMVVGGNISNPAMVSCCHPNKVQLHDSCYLWCRIPGGDYYTNTNQTGAPKSETRADIFRNISSCLTLNGLNEGNDGELGAIHAHIVSASMAGTRRVSLSTMGLGVWALVMFGGVLMH